MNIILKVGKWSYRQLGLSAFQRKHLPFKGKILTADVSNQLLSNIIQIGKPFMVSRLGTVETAAIFNNIEIVEGKSGSFIKKFHAKLRGNAVSWDENIKHNLLNNSGFFPLTEEMLENFSNYFIEQIKKNDAISIWGFVVGETWLINRYCRSAIKYNPIGLEPYYFDNPWSESLFGKKVLVVHPFSKSIESQYECREFLFDNKNILPKFELITIKAVQSIGGNKTDFDNWFDALKFMQGEIDKVDFDVAIIGAGSYGLPLSAYVKEKGKIAIHMGGATQILFGIMGRRWDNHPEISKLYNDYWIRPDATELVKNANRIEEGCYW